MACLADADVPFTLSGLQVGDKVSVTISSNEYLNTMSITADGSYAFENVPTGQHAIKVEAIGYNLPDSKLVIAKDDGTIEPFTGIKLVITKQDEDDSVWTHSWHEDGSISGYTTTAYVNKPAEIEYLGKKIVPADVPSQSILESDYNIILSDEGAKWTQEYAYRLLETLKCFPNNYGGVYGDTIIISLTTENIYQDIQMEDCNSGKLVTLATEAFAYANPFLVNLDGVRGRFFSKRLHHAIVNMLTNFGNNKSRADQIFQKRFGCSIYPPDYLELTNGTTNEDGSHFQEFAPSELVELLNMFEEMPEGFHAIPGLNYLIRRQNGHIHPLYGEAAAVAWAENGYIEFMYQAFNGIQLVDTHRLMIHEKTHMLWAHVFSDEIKNDWIELGGWYPDPNNGGWATTKDTEFVSAYAHDNNPNEDMAESVAFYIKDPDKLMSRSLPKYEFIRDRIMHGTRYISKIRDDLTFEVLNLFPDYDYPGKIKSLDVQVLGKPEEDKTVIIDITLNHIEGFQDGASGAYLRMKAPAGVKFEDMRPSPVDGDLFHLRGYTTISKYNKSGYWTCNNIQLTDEHGNERLEGSNDFVWNMYINNPLEDVEPPIIEGENVRYELKDQEIDGHQGQLLTIYCKMTDNVALKSWDCGVWTVREEESKQLYGNKRYDYNEETHEAKIMYEITEFAPSCDYYISHLFARDIAQNETFYNYYPENRPTFHVTTPNPDYMAPEVDLNRMSIYAEPVNKETPDGETIVTLNFFTRDDKSGVLQSNYTLRDPQGIDHFVWYNEYADWGDNPPDTSDPTIWQRRKATVILPRGSAPGIWGVAFMEIQDKVGNVRKYDFVETLIFEPDDNLEDYVLFAEMSSEDMLNFDLTAISGNTTGYSYVYRVISEESGQEINGVIDDIGQPAAAMRRTQASNGYNVDVSSLPDGKLIVIVEVKDEKGDVVAVRSKTVMKYSVGDVNSDGDVTAQDASLVLQAVAGKIELSAAQRQAADVNGDGDITAQDASLILQYVAGKISW